MSDEGSARELAEGIRKAVLQRRAAAAGEQGQPEIAAALAELSRSKLLLEPRASSHRPVLGRLIVLLRSNMVRLFLGWYLRPILRQQTLFNEAAESTLARMLQDQRSMGHEVDKLRARLEELEGSGVARDSPAERSVDAGS